MSGLITPRSAPISLSMPLRPAEAPYRGPGVEAFFDNLLPDNPEVRRRIQARYGAAGARAFSLLEEIGRDCVGALQLLPPDMEPGKIQTIQGAPLGERDVAALLRNVHVTPLTGLPDSGEFRMSLAGFQSKTALLFHKGRWHLPTGPTPTTHILKLPMGDKVGVVQADLSASVENEWLCNRVLEAFGMSAAHCEMACFEDQQVLVVERFDRRLAEDRSWWIQLPQEDMCQALGTPLGLKYESEGAPGMKDILEMLLGSRDSAIDRRTFLKAQVLFWILCAIDGHARNFSVFIGRGGRYRLTPLYDVISAYPILGHGRNQLAPEKARMAMSVRGQGRQYLWDRITRKHWIETAKAVGMGGEIGGILEETMEETPRALEKAGNSLPKEFPGRVHETIFKGIRKAVKRLAVTD